MREALRDEKTLAVIGRQNLGVPTQEGGRAATKVYRDVEDLAAQAADELVFDVRRELEMKATYDTTANGERVVDLRHRPGESCGGQLLRTVETAEESASVFS